MGSPVFASVALVARDALLAATVVCGLAVGLSLLYCLFLLIVALLARRGPHGASSDAPSTRFCLLIPAHNEELVVGATLETLQRLDYPKALKQIVVIADNCDDETARIAARSPGALVLQRENLTERGKGHALNWVLAQLLPTETHDAYVIVDADTQVDPQFLKAMDKARRSGEDSRGYFAAQGRYDVLNDDDGWRAALMAGALALAHGVRPLARERLGLSVGLKGNGMCFSAPTLRAVAWSNSLTEDIDFAMDLLEQLDARVRYVPEALVAAQMPVTAQAASSQRDRWERGRFEILRRRGGKLLAAGFRQFDFKKIDAALDLIVPPLAEMAGGLALWGVLLVLLHSLGGAGLVAFAIWGGAVLSLIVYILAGFAVGGAPKSAYGALLRAPVYIVWKLALRVIPKRRESDAWVRTERTAMSAPVSDTASPPEAAAK